MQIDDNTYTQLEKLGRRSGRSTEEEVRTAVQAYLLTELERHAREGIRDPKSPPS